MKKCEDVFKEFSDQDYQVQVHVCSGWIPPRAPVVSFYAYGQLTNSFSTNLLFAIGCRMLKSITCFRQQQRNVSCLPIIRCIQRFIPSSKYLQVLHIYLNLSAGGSLQSKLENCEAFIFDYAAALGRTKRF